MKREVKGILVFAGLLLLVLAGFYISYISLKDNLPVGESFASFVGNAMKQFGPQSAKVDNKLVLTKKELETKMKRSAIEEVLQSIAINGCFKAGCYDTDGNDPTIKGRVYIRKGYLKTLIANEPIPSKTPEGNPVKQIEGKLYQCVPVDDYCKDTANVEQTCGFGQGGVPTVKTSFSICPCGCANGVCIQCQPIKLPDLVVKSIAKNALSEQCLNSFTFTMCNNGDADLKDTFTLIVTSNGITREYEVKQSNIEKLTAGSCLDIKVPGLFNVGSFGYALNTNADLTVTLDTTKKIDEKDETNNEAKETVFTGTAYYYDKDTTCDTFCFETDVGQDYNNYGKLTYKYSGDTNQNEDLCSPYDLNGLELFEQYCKIPIIMKTNKKFSNPYAQETYNCLDQVKKCSAGQCVPLTVTCEDAYGKEGPCLQCLDYEGSSNPDSSKYKNLGDVYEAEKDIDPFVKGNLDYTDIDNKKQNFVDTCLATDFGPSKEVLIDYYCDSYNKYPLVESKQISCYRLKTAEGKGHVCSDGKCVPTDIDFEKCEGPTNDKTDPFVADTVTETKLLGEKNIQTDWCSGDDNVVEYYCDGKYLASKSTNCDTLIDKNGKGASCVKGKCVFFDASLMSCTENGDVGLDTLTPGYIQFVTGYGKQDSQSDYCPDDDTLIESYCNGKEPTIVPHSCKDEGKVCDNGACKIADMTKLSCTDTEIKNGKAVVDKTLSGEVFGFDQFGQEYGYEDKCASENSIKEWSCNGKQPKDETIKCDLGTLCQEGVCKFADDSLKSCKVDPNNKNRVLYTDKFGTPNDQKSQCQKWIGPKSITAVSCNGVEPISKDDSCQEGFECKQNYETGAECAKVDYSKKSCIETPDGALTVNQFGEGGSGNNYCSQTKTLNKATCVNNELSFIDAACPAGQACNSNTNSCAVIDNSKMSCKVIGNNMISVVDEFGNEYTSTPGCASGISLVVPSCEGNKPLDPPKTEFCNVGEECNFNTGQCQTVDYSKVSCSGPTQPNFDKKEKVIAYDPFGQQVFLGKGGQQFNEDICVKDVELDQPANAIVEFWCEGTKMQYEVFECPAGKTCKSGICI